MSEANLWFVFLNIYKKYFDMMNGYTEIKRGRRHKYVYINWLGYCSFKFCLF